MKQSPRNRHAENLKRLSALERGADLKSRSENNEVLTVDELVDLINLVDRFGVKGDAVPYGEKTASLYPGSSKALIALADLIRSDQKDKALELYKRAVQLEPESWEVYSKRGWFYRWNLGAFGEAEKDFRTAIKLSDGRDSRAWQGLGDVLALQGQRKEAIEAYKTYLRVRKDAASYYDPVIKKQIKELEKNPEGPSAKASP
jgi:tetratricopeptide (TPR) repeat protein